MTRDDFKQLALFISSRYEPAAKWPESVLLDYICWAADNDFLFIARDADESIKGAALARPVAELPEREDEFSHEGDIVFIDCMVAVDNKAFQLLGYTILETFSSCGIVAFQRLNRGEKVKLYPADKVRNTLFKLRN